MKKHILLLAISCFLAINICKAQDEVYKTYSWEKSPALHQIPEQYQSAPAVIVKDHRLTELVAGDYGQNFAYITEHKIVRVSTDAAIERFNKVYIPLSQGGQLMSLKVRSINPEGDITTLNRENLKELKNVEGYGKFKIFAVEGLVKGGEMEYLYTLKQSPLPFGREILQGKDPIMSSSFEMVYPSYLSFSGKCYNGCPQPFQERLKTNEKKKSMGVQISDVAGMEEEEYSAYRRNLMYLDYKMENSRYVSNLFSWDKIADSLFKTINDNKGQQKVYKMFNSLKLNGNMPLEQRLIAVEKYIKNNFTIKEGNSEAYTDLKSIMTNKYASESGITKVYFHCFNYLGLKPEIVFTGSRYDSKIDPNYSTYMGLNDVLFYFKEWDKYLVPGAFNYRLGPAPSYLASNNGLFISYGKSYNTSYNVYGKIKKIAPLALEKNRIGVIANIQFDETTMEPFVKQVNESYGYRAINYRAAFYASHEEKEKEMIKEFVLSAYEDANLKEYKLEEKSMEASVNMDTPFKIHTEYTAQSLLEKAGNDYLFNIGKVIGKQSELYQQSERTSDIEFPTPSDYHHEITLTLPKGYTLKGLDKLNISNEVIVDDEPIMIFKSGYTLEDNKLTVKINEYYKVLQLSKEYYEDFRKVINSAADFNKVTLVLEPVD